DDAGVLSTVRLAAPTVAALLDAAGAPLQQSDSVVPAPSTPLAEGMIVKVTRVRIEKVTERIPLAPNNQRIEDVTLNMSRQIVESPGNPGVQDVTFAVAKINGVETGRLPVANVVIAPARDGVLRIG
ncbi:resuscitation-promoting factor, partial [Mycobacterium sp. ITM-2017-0098]